MPQRPYIIRISSQKGGVGKTSVAVNLGVALGLLGYKVLLVDADTANPSVGVQLGMTQANIGYREVVSGKATLNSAMAMYSSSGLRVLPGTINPYSFIPGEKENRAFLKALGQTKHDFVIVDTSPGVSLSEPFSLYSEALLITTPEVSSCTAAIRLAHNYTAIKLRHNLVVNRVKNKNYEFGIDEIEDMYENRVIGVLPEDEAVPTSISQHIPAYLLNPRSAFSGGIRAIGRRYATRTEAVEIGVAERIPREGVFAFILRLLRLRR